jgi:hypothetical protein
MKKAILTSQRPVTRTEGSKAFPLNENGMPKGNGTPESLGDIIKFLAVEKSARYKPLSRDGKIVATYCNIYAFDFCNLAGGYLPRVWWSGVAAKEVKAGKDVVAKYGETVFELNANSLLDWFNEWSDDFGWKKETDLEQAQKKANEGQIVILVGKQKIVSRSGHITAIVPETPEHKALKSQSGMFEPLQSQAGASNKSYFNQNWFLHPRYSDWGCWSFKAF